MFNYILNTTKLQGLNLFWFRQVIHGKRSLAQTCADKHETPHGLWWGIFLINN